MNEFRAVTDGTYVCRSLYCVERITTFFDSFDMAVKHVDHRIAPSLVFPGDLHVIGVFHFYPNLSVILVLEVVLELKDWWAGFVYFANSVHGWNGWDAISDIGNNVLFSIILDSPSFHIIPYFVRDWSDCNSSFDIQPGDCISVFC